MNVITRDLRHAIARAVATGGFDTARFDTGGFRGLADPGLRPAGTPGRYAASVALSLGTNPRQSAATLAATLASEQWIATAEVTGPGYITITVTPEALAAVAGNVIAAGPACVASDALAGVTVPAVPPGDPLTPDPGKEGTWEEARAALAARLTARLAVAAGATPQAEAPPPLPVAETAPYMSDAPRRDIYGNFMTPAERQPGVTGAPERRYETDVARAVAFAGRDAVTFILARAIPGRPLRIDPQIIARHVPGNPAYAVRYAHARAASGVRWAVVSRGGRPSVVSAGRPDGKTRHRIGPARRDSDLRGCG